MKKRHVIHLLSDYLDNLLPETQRQEVEKHLTSCKRCQTKLKQLQDYQKAVSNLEQRRAPEEIHTNVIAEIESRLKTQDARRKMEHGTWNIEHGTSKKLITGHWSLVTGIAAIIILLVLAIPKQWFMPTTINTDVIAEVPKKKGKGGPAVTIGGVFVEERGDPSAALRTGKREERGEIGISDLRLSIVDFRLDVVLDIVEEVKGKVLVVELNSSENAYSRIMVGMKKKSYKTFAEKYNELGFGEKIPPRAGFSISNNVIVNLFPVKRKFYVRDYNEDGFDDMILHYTSGRLEGEWFVALNDHMGNFYPLLEIKADSLPPPTRGRDSTITFMGDFNGDGLTDMLTKEGDGDVLGLWYLMLNDGSMGFGGSRQVSFGGSEYLVVGD